MTPIGGSYPSGNERAIREAWDGKHAPAACKRVAGSAHFHTKSWSYRFECPKCGQSRRYNTNFLGNRNHLVCDGQRITRMPRPEHVCGLRGFGAIGDTCPACEIGLL
jgi:hypothetical protein